MSTSTTGPFADWDETKETKMSTSTTDPFADWDETTIARYGYTRRRRHLGLRAVNGLVFDADRANYDAGAAHMRDTIMIAPGPLT